MNSLRRIRAALVLLLVMVVSSSGVVLAADPPAADPLSAAVEQLRNAIGTWDVTTMFMKPDGTPARTVEGTYTFQWAVPDRVVSGISAIPELEQTSAILFYVNEKKQTIEMVSVGADGHLWIMTGAAGDETRYSQKFESQDGKTSQFRFTRFHVSPDRFESRMDYTEDDGVTWVPGNHQEFRRQK